MNSTDDEVVQRALDKAIDITHALEAALLGDDCFLEHEGFYVLLVQKLRNTIVTAQMFLVPAPTVTTEGQPVESIR